MMRAAVLAGPGKVRLDAVDLPYPGPGQVRVRLEGCGVCASNLTPWAGPEWMQFPTEPGALGHEGWGVSEAVEAVASGRLDPFSLYTHRYPVDRLGEALDATRDRPDGFLKVPDKPWFYDPALSGGGCVMDLGVHLVDLALWTLGGQVTDGSAKLFAGGEPLGGRADRVEDYATASIGLDSGTAVQLACSWRLHAGCDAVISAAFFGTEGGAILRNVNGSFYDFTAERCRGTAREALASPPEAWGGRAAADWAMRLAAGERFDPAAEGLIDVARALDRIYGR